MEKIDFNKPIRFVDDESPAHYVGRRLSGALDGEWP